MKRLRRIHGANVIAVPFQLPFISIPSVSSHRFFSLLTYSSVPCLNESSN